MISFGLVFFSKFIASWIQPLLVILSAMIWGTINYRPSIQILQAIYLLADIGTFGVVALWITVAEGRSFSTLGFFKKLALREIRLGLLLGMLGIALVLGSEALLVPFDISLNRQLPLSIGGVVAYFISVAIWSTASILIVQGYLLPVISRYHKRWLAIWASSLLGAFFSAINTAHFSLIFLVNEALLACLLCLLVLWRRNLWLATSIFTLWQFMTTSLLGMSSSPNYYPSHFWTQVNPNQFFFFNDSGATYSLYMTLVLTLLVGVLAWVQKDQLRK